jgi:DNA polymerase-3 subunit delta'
MTASGAGGIRDELRRMRRSGGVHGAYLFEGPPGTGRNETALWFARLLLCRGDEDDPCGRCGDCRRSGVGSEEPAMHPDLHQLEPDGATLKIDQVRALQARLSLVANEGGRRVGLILGAEKLNEAAANALLKTLEEPPRDTTLILVATSGDTLPPTIRSRTVRLRFARQPESEVAAALIADGLPEADAALAAALGGGSVTAARAWAEASLDDAREMRDALLDAGQAQASAALDFAEGFRGGAPARARCELLLAVHAAVARQQIEEALRADDRAATERWLERAESAERARKEMARRNLNPQLIAEGLLLAMQPVTS